MIDPGCSRFRRLTCVVACSCGCLKGGCRGVRWQQRLDKGCIGHSPPTPKPYPPPPTPHPQDERGVSRDEMAAALDEVATGRIPKDRIALKCLYEDMAAWPDLVIQQ